MLPCCPCCWCLIDIWMLLSRLTKKQLLAQCSNIRKRQLPSHLYKCLEMDNIYRTLKAFIQNSVGLWKILGCKLKANCKLPSSVVYTKVMPCCPVLTWTPSARSSQRVATDICSEMEQPSVISFRLMTLSCMPGMSETLTHCHKHVCPASHQVPRWYDKQAKGSGTGHKKAPQNAWGLSIPNPTTWDCTLRGEEEIKDWWASEPRRWEVEPFWRDKHLHTACTMDKLKKWLMSKKSHQWLEKVGLRNGTEALIMVSQEQALRTRVIDVGVCCTRQDPRCGLCKDAPESEIL